MKVLFILSFLFIAQAKADFILSPGAGFSTAGKSDESLNGRDVLKTSSGVGLVANMDWIVFRPLTIGIGAGYYSHISEVQYQNDQAIANKLDATMGQLNFEVGAKLRFINFKRFKVFIGGGLSAGNLSLSFDQDDFEETTGGENGYEMRESKSYTGHYWDAGIEYIFSNTSGLRISVKDQTIKSKKFENLGDKELNLEFVNVNIQYMHYVNWDFFFK